LVDVLTLSLPHGDIDSGGILPAEEVKGFLF